MIPLDTVLFPLTHNKHFPMEWKKKNRLENIIVVTHFIIYRHIIWDHLMGGAALHLFNLSSFSRLHGNKLFSVTGKLVKFQYEHWHKNVEGIPLCMLINIDSDQTNSWIIEASDVINDVTHLPASLNTRLIRDFLDFLTHTSKPRNTVAHHYQTGILLFVSCCQPLFLFIIWYYYFSLF